MPIHSSIFPPVFKILTTSSRIVYAFILFKYCKPIPKSQLDTLAKNADPLLEEFKIIRCELYPFIAQIIFVINFRWKAVIFILGSLLLIDS